MNTVWIESEPESWECGEPGCCYEAWTNYRITANGEAHEVNDRSGQSLLDLLLVVLGYTNWRIETEGAETCSDSHDPAAADALEFVASNRWNTEDSEVVSCHLVLQSKDTVFLDQVYDTPPSDGVRDNRWLVTHFLAALDWHVQW